MKKNLLGGSSLSVIVAAATMATAAQAAPVTITETLTLGQILSGGQSVGGTFNINGMLSPPTDFNQPYDILGATITAYGYAPDNSSTQYGSYGPNQYAGTNYSPYYYQAPVVYSYSYYYGGTYVSANSTYYTSAQGTSSTTSDVSQRSVTTTDSVDTLSLNVGAQSATDQTTAVTSGPTGGSLQSNGSYSYAQGYYGYVSYAGYSTTYTFYYYSCGWFSTCEGSYYSPPSPFGYSYNEFETTGYATTNYYLQDLYSSSIANGPLATTVFLAPDNLADLAADGLLNFSVDNLGGYFSADLVTLSVTLDANPVDVPEPGSWAVLLGGLAIGAGMIAARQKSVLGR